jgi:nucleoside-diphosphate-sugar epimerase
MTPETTNSDLMHDKGSRCSGKEIILVTGGGGFIGSAIIDKLSKNYRMIALDKGLAKLPIASEGVYMDMTSDESIEAALARVQYGYGNKIASVIHLAAYYDFSGKPSPLYDKITVQGTQKLLRALQKFNVRQFVFSSSLLVYAPSEPGQKINEEWALAPNWDYPDSKVKSEKIIHAERNKIPVVILRIAGVYSDMGNSIPIANHIQRIYEKQLSSHFFPGEVSHGNPFIHLDDLVDAIVKTVEKRNELPPDVTINLAENETLSYEFLQKSIGKSLYNKEWKTYKIPKPLAKVGAWLQDIFGDPFIKPWMIDMADNHMEADIKKAEKMLGWEPKLSLRETLPKMIGLLKSDPKKWYLKNKLKLPSRLKE